MKKIVYYVGIPRPIMRESVMCAALFPVNHPDCMVSNEKEAVTSDVISWEQGGRIETKNTVYCPVEIPGQYRARTAGEREH